MISGFNEADIADDFTLSFTFSQIGLLQICGHLRCRFTKNSPRRTKSTPAGIFCALLASAPPIFKSAGCKGISFVTTHKLILDVSKLPRRAVVSSRSKFVYKLAAQKCARMYIFGRGCPWL